MTDDQTVESMRVMAKTNALIAAQGVTFRDNVVSFPLCGPSRAAFLTGQYAHNNHLKANSQPVGGIWNFKWQDTTFPAALQEAGYTTIHVGKYVNGYGRDSVDIPPGWTEWYGSIDPTTYRYYDYTVNQNGELTSYGSDEQDYQTDVYADIASEVIRRHADDTDPYFLNVWFMAPHVQIDASTAGLADEYKRAVAAPRHLGRCADEPLPRPPSFDEEDVSAKPKWVQELPRMNDETVQAVTDTYRAFLESLLAVDDAVERVIDALEATGQLDDTIVIFTSDNGLFYGEHRQPVGKLRLYEPAVRVPLVMRGPGIPRGEERTSLVANIDLAPTILEFAQAQSLRVVDGRSFVSILEHEDGPWPREVLLDAGEVWRPDNAIRTTRWFYAEYFIHGERELYDLERDPDQVHNLSGDPAYAAIEADLAARLDKLRGCVGDTCG
jgi:N-acetylglucosamine-6-sulfatase